jgi:hypothetical protein
MMGVRKHAAASLFPSIPRITQMGSIQVKEAID